MNSSYTEEERWQIAYQFLPLIIKIAKGYTTELLDLDDLIQEGYLLVYEDIVDYDETKGMKLSNYLLDRLRWRFYELSISSKFELKVSRKLRFQSVSLYHKEIESLVAYHRPMTMEEKQKKIKASKTTINTLEWINRYARNINFVYLDAIKMDFENNPTTVDDYSDQDSDLFFDSYREKVRDSYQLEEEVITSVFVEEIVSMIKELPDAQKQVLLLRFGLEGGRPYLLEEIGKELGFTFQYASQLYYKGIKTIQKKLKNSNLF